MQFLLESQQLLQFSENRRMALSQVEGLPTLVFCSAHELNLIPHARAYNILHQQP